MNQGKARWQADLLQGIFACAAGAITIGVLHDLWFVHWMDLLGDPPASNPAYDSISFIFVSLPFIIGPIVIGLIAGFGMTQPWWRIAVRFFTGPILSLPVLLKESPEHTSLYIPMLLLSFIVSVMMASLYHQLAVNRENHLMNEEESP